MKDEQICRNKKRHQEEFNAFPLYFAFSKDQFNKILDELGLNEDENMIDKLSDALNDVYNSWDEEKEAVE